MFVFDVLLTDLFMILQTWVSEAAGFRLNCSCSGPQTYNCDTGEWCHVDDKVYNLGEKWTNIYEETNKKEVCVCNGRAGYLCYPRSKKDYIKNNHMLICFRDNND